MDPPNDGFRAGMIFPETRIAFVVNTAASAGPICLACANGTVVADPENLAGNALANLSAASIV